MASHASGDVPSTPPFTPPSNPLTKPPTRWLFWHPHQGLANGRLVDAIRRHVRPWIFARALTRCLIEADTALLTIRAVWHRLVRLGPLGVFATAKVPAGVRIVYVDLGTHERASELRLALDALLPETGDAFQAYGFEANPRSFAQASELLADRAEVTLVHAAVCDVVPADGVISLYLSEGGLSDSLLGDRGPRVDVPAVRLSEFLRTNEPDLARSILLLRMNIEGAEAAVLDDLIHSDLVSSIDGWFGMWDDLSKTDPTADVAFRGLIRRIGIRKSTFNGRDLPWSRRVRVIRYEWATAVMAGVARLAANPDSV